MVTARRHGYTNVAEELPLWLLQMGFLALASHKDT